MSKLEKRPKDFDWNQLNTLRLRARAIADGLYVGIHRSAKRGVGVEFGGRRNYVPGDDLRWLDRHALMRHGRLLVREFETDTDRLLYLVIDATASMTYQSKKAQISKWAYTATLASALAHIALYAGDPVALDWIGGSQNRWLPAMSGHEAFERVVSALETTQPSHQQPLGERAFERCLVPVDRYARTGSIVVVLTDLIDLPETAVARLSELSNRKRSVVVVRVLDPAELLFPFQGATRFRALEGTHVVETDAALSRPRYLEELARRTAEAEQTILAHGGRLICTDTSKHPVDTVLNIVHTIGRMRG
jgi:uncharacterized protein (DUF58 family)